MKKFLVLVTLIATLGGFSIVANAQESNRNDCNLETKRYALEQLIQISLTDCEEGSEETKNLWSLHEELPKLSEAEIDMYYAQLIQNNIWASTDNKSIETNRKILDNIIINTISQYDEGSEEAKELWGLHEEVKKFTEEEVNILLRQLSIE